MVLYSLTMYYHVHYTIVEYVLMYKCGSIGGPKIRVFLPQIWIRLMHNVPFIAV